jgi:hypothetical protein
VKLVTFARATPPHGAGDTRLLPDDVADRLGAEGALSASVAWPAGTPASAKARKPRRVVPVPTRPAGRPDGRIAR